ncbi:rhodanese-like domain-containing protein [Thiohalobacter sp.]|uniref:rhodanese-like domain-containing protein n=1 Tax=Thiohalobacter sp. TaxID=2025948 RepID=UPI00295000E7|nr:rhodanese-like domain-containing protein [Thiohalobacter sp.]
MNMFMKTTRTLVLSIALAASGNLLAGDGIKVKITPDLAKVTVTHDGKKIDIMRNQNQKNTVNPAFAKTSRKCPPFCIQPIRLAPGVETIGEVEMLDYLARKEAGDDSILVIDSRTPDWVERGTIPGSVNIPWTQLNPARSDPFTIADILEKRFGARTQEGLWDYSNAKTLVMFCNGMWCGQSPNNIKALLKYGYPAHKIKWYRGGMQDWEILGLTTVKAAK